MKLLITKASNLPKLELKVNTLASLIHSSTNLSTIRYIGLFEAPNILSYGSIEKWSIDEIVYR